jgi:hypothetical protein
MVLLKCESKNPNMENGVAVGVGRTFDKSEIQKAEDDAERKAIDSGFEDAMIYLGWYGCKGDCERRISVSFEKIKVVRMVPQQVNGAKLYEVLVSVQWVLDVNCVRPRPGSGVKHGRLE